MGEIEFGWRDVEEARGRIEGELAPTPLVESYYLGTGLDEGAVPGGAPGLAGTGARYFFKLENVQRVKSFKIRGVLNKLLSLTPEEAARGVCAVSSGNHGGSVAFAAQRLGIPATIVVPETAPKSKVDKMRFFGADVVQLGRNFDEAHHAGMDYLAGRGLTYVDSYYDDPKIYAGQGTMAVEMLRQNPELDTIVAAVGGGSMVTGIAVAAKHLKPGIRVLGAQTAACPALAKALEDDCFYEDYPTEGETLCDSTVGGIGALCWQMARDVIDGVLVVSEREIAQAVAFMAGQEKVVAEAGSCIAVAAALFQPEALGGRNVGIIISGGNIDADVLARCLAEHAPKR